MTMRWAPSGLNHIMATWVFETQVIYLLEHNPASLLGGEYWRVVRTVAGARKEATIGTSDDLDGAKKIAEDDASDTEQKGF